jgi:hypothetical protein
MGMTRCGVIVKGLFRSEVSMQAYGWKDVLENIKSNRIGTWFWVFLSLNVPEFSIFDFTELTKIS